MDNQQNFRRPLTEDETQWLNSHKECLCDLTDSLFVYGASKVYDLRKSSSQAPESFFGNFIILLRNNMIEIWTADSVEALSEFVK